MILLVYGHGILSALALHKEWHRSSLHPLGLRGDGSTDETRQQQGYDS